jgi:hypothetical protein
MKTNEETLKKQGYFRGYEEYLRKVNERKENTVVLELSRQEALTLVSLLRSQQYTLKVFPECQSVLDKLLGFKK